MIETRTSENDSGRSQFRSLLLLALGLACASRPGTTGGTTPTGGVAPAAGQVGASANGGAGLASGGTTTALGGATGSSSGGAAGATTGTCGSKDVPIDSSGWVDVAATGCGIQGAWWWATDDQGTTVDGAIPDSAPYVAGKGMCLKGKTVADPTYAAWGAIIGLDLNANLGPGWNATAHNVVGFDVEITGAATAELRLELESKSNRTTSPPFVAAAPGRKVLLVDRAIVPLTWDVPNQGEKADASNLAKLQLKVAGGGPAPADFDICITRVRPIVANCADNAMIDADGNKVNNNVWGKESVTDYSQCVFATGAGADTQFGWIWRWPISTPAWQVRSYPEIMVGKSPWNSVNTGHGLPAPITDHISFTFDLDLELGANDSYDFAPEIWLTSGPQPTSSNITDEIMFWFLHNNMSPAGSLVGSFSNGGVDYDVWRNPQHDPGAGSPTTGWQYIAFVARTPIRSGTIDVSSFLQYLVSKGTIASGRYVAGVELGTEITNGKGSAIVSNFSASASP
jgi:hypothetical protein